LKPLTRRTSDERDYSVRTEAGREGIEVTIRLKRRAGIVVGIDREPSETQFKQHIADLARLHGWKVAHFRPARTEKGWRTACEFDAKGWPDLFLVKGTVALALELKVGKRKATPEQCAWLDALEYAGIVTAIVRPGDWPWIEKTLRGE
jgi:hypothetical protein